MALIFRLSSSSYMPLSLNLANENKDMQAAKQQLNESSSEVFIGRQPILDRDLNTYAYELLFRPATGNSAEFLDGEKATAQVIYNSLMEIGLDNLVGTSLAYINFTRDTLIGDIGQLLPPDKVVLEVLEDVEIDDDLTEGIKSLVDKGYCVALDDFEYHPKWDILISLAKVIKFDVRALDHVEIKRQIDLIKRHDIKLLAEKVETQEEFKIFRDMGFDYFQGYFFAKPKVIRSDKLPDDRVSLLNLISRLQDKDIETEEIELLVSQNISLSYKLLRYINSASFALTRKIESIRQIVIYFGLQRLKNWTTLMAMTDVGEKSSELIQTALIRARMCELLAIRKKFSETDSYFMLGLFSILDALMNCTMEDILEKLPIAKEVKQALLTKEGEHGLVLKSVIASEQNKWSDVGQLGIIESELNDVYMESILWARQAMEGIS